MTEVGSEPSATQKREVQTRDQVIAGLVLAAYLVLMLWFFASRMSGPIIYEDEHGPIETARVLVGQQEVAETKYYPGYAFTLVPGTAAANTPYGEYRAALLANVLMIAGSAVVLYLALLRAYPSAPWRVALPVGVAFSLPHATSSAGLIWSEAGLIAVVTVVAALTAWYAALRWPVIAIAASGLSGLALVFHPRLVALVPSVLLAVLLIETRRSERIRLAFECGVSALAGLVAAYLLRSWVTGQIGSTVDYGTPRPRLDRGMDLVTDLSGVVTGRVSTDLLAAAFLPIAALAIPEVRRRLADLAPLTALALSLVVLTLLYTAANVGWSGIPRSDFVYYTRYQGPGVLLLAAIAGVALCQRGNVRRWGHPFPLVLFGAAMVAGWLAVRALVDSSVFERTLVQANVPELAHLGRDLHPDRVFLLVGVIGLGLLLVNSLPLDRTVTVVVAGLLALSLSSTWYEDFAHPGSRGRSAERALVPHFEFLEAGDCVLYDRHSVSFWNRANYEFFSRARFLPVDRAEQDCGPLLIVGEGTSLDIPNSAEPLGTERVPGLTLYRLPTDGLPEESAG